MQALLKSSHVKLKMTTKRKSKRIHCVDRYHHKLPVSEELSLRHVTGMQQILKH